jgi:hypothetical protein
MYRDVTTAEIRYGHWNDAIEGYQEINRLCAERGLRQSRMLIPAFGRANLLVAEVEYDTLAELEDEQRRFYSDSDIMKQVRRMAEITVQGSVVEELYQDAEHIA